MGELHVRPNRLTPICKRMGLCVHDVLCSHFAGLCRQQLQRHYHTAVICTTEDLHAGHYSARESQAHCKAGLGTWVHRWHPAGADEAATLYPTLPLLGLTLTACEHDKVPQNIDMSQVK